MDDSVEVICPYCFEQVEIYVEPESEGEMVSDCDVCCRPLALRVSHDEDGEPQVSATRAQ